MDKKLPKELSGIKETHLKSSIKDIRAVSQSHINKTWQLILNNGEKIFAKTTNYEEFDMLKFESNALIALREFCPDNELIIPHPLLLDRNKTNSILLLPWLDLENGNQIFLGKGLALLHKNSSRKNIGIFGWQEKGFIGAGLQTAGLAKKWGDCFVNFRLRPQIHIATRWGLNNESLEELLLSINSYLNNHNPIPSLVHGDLWSGNVGTNNNGKGILIDPATYWADREVDLAMTKMFGGFSKEFYDSYNKLWPLPEDHKYRVEIYNLYHLINHANIFGGHYKKECIEITKKLKKTFIN